MISRFDDISDLIGETLTEVSGADRLSETITFCCASGRRFVLFHRHDCCESVSVEDVTGDVADLIGCPIVMAEIVENDSDPPPTPVEYGSYTWSFVKLATARGYVTIRWYGQSDGYYCETPSFERCGDQ